jgi:hypothetical protein
VAQHLSLKNTLLVAYTPCVASGSFSWACIVKSNIFEKQLMANNFI